MTDRRQLVPNIVENSGGNLHWDELWVRDFGTSFATLPQALHIAGKAFEIVFKFKHKPYVTTYQPFLFCDVNGTSPSLSFYINKYNIIGCNVYGTSDWRGEFNGHTQLIEGNIYWAKLARETATSNYKTYLSTDGENWTLESTSSYVNDPGRTEDRSLIGVSSDKVQRFQGAIDLSDCYINVNGERFWSGTKEVAVNLPYIAKRNSSTIIPNVLQRGNVRWSADENFGTRDYNNNNYLYLDPDKNDPRYALANANSWQIVSKFKYVANGKAQAIFADNTPYENLFGIRGNNKEHIGLTLAQGTDSFDIGTIAGSTTLVNGKTYYAMAEFTGTQYNVYLKENINDEWHLEGTLSSTKKISTKSAWRFGNNRPNTEWVFEFAGEIYIKDTYININGQRWWSGTKEVASENYYIPAIRNVYRDMTIPNVNIIGNFRPDQYGSFVGFSATQYLTKTVSIPSTINSVEYIVRINTPPNWGARVCFTSGHSWNQLPTMTVTSSGQIQCYLSGNGTSNDIINGLVSSSSLNTNSNYRVKYVYDGSTHSIQVSADGGNTYQTWISVNNTTPPKFDGFICLGINYYGIVYDTDIEPYSGYIGVTYCSLKLNGVEVWNGAKEVRKNKLYPALIHLDANNNDTPFDPEPEPEPEPEPLYYCYEEQSYLGSGVALYDYIKLPIGVDKTVYGSKSSPGQLVSQSSELESKNILYDSATEEKLIYTITSGYFPGTYNALRDSAHDLYS